MQNRKEAYEGFTLIEMLIVMAIIILLIVLGAMGRQAAINRATRIQVQAGVKGFTEALVAFHSDHYEYPNAGTKVDGTAIGSVNPGTLITEENTGPLDAYLDTFEGGPDTAYFYSNEGSPYQMSIVCASMGGVGDRREQGYYCSGDGFDTEMFGAAGVIISEREVEPSDDTDSAYQWLNQNEGGSGPANEWGSSYWSTESKEFTSSLDDGNTGEITPPKDQPQPLPVEYD